MTILTIVDGKVTQRRQRPSKTDAAGLTCAPSGTCFIFGTDELETGYRSQVIPMTNSKLGTPQHIARTHHIYAGADDGRLLLAGNAIHTPTQDKTIVASG